MNGLKIQRLKGKQILEHIDDLASLRINVFKEYPYLYQGTLEYEMNYLKTYIECKEAILVIATDNSKVVGVSSAIPMEFEVAECQKPFLDNHLPISNIFYFGESVLLSQYRGKGIYRHFFQERENAAKAYGSTLVTFCAVERKENDPKRPQNYAPLDKVWHHFGYKKRTDFRTFFTWQEIGETQETAKSMVFWTKEV